MNSLSRTEHPNQKPVAQTRILTTTLDAIISQPEIGALRLIKIDTEGAERQILLPAVPRLRTLSQVRVLFESQDANNRGFGYSTKQFLIELQSAGAQVSQLDETGQVTRLELANPEIGNAIYNFVLSFDR
jgi:hypothetical protein